MTDLEMTKLCADALGMPNRQDYDPINDDAQAMALVKKFGMGIDQGRIGGDKSGAALFRDGVMWGATATDLNRAIVECVAKMQAAK